MHKKGKIDRNKKKKKDILIVIDKFGVGDIVPIMDGLYNLSRYLNSENGYNSYLAIDKSLIKFLAACHSSFNLSMIGMEFMMPEKYSQVCFRKNYESINIKEWDLVISFDPLGGYSSLLLMGVRYKKIIMPEISSYKPLWKRIIDSFLDYDAVDCYGTEKKLCHKASISKDVVSEVIYREFKISDKLLYKKYKISSELDESDITNIYCCVSTGINSKTNIPYRSWNVDKYGEVLKYILCNTHMDIILVGSDGDKESNDKLFKMFHGNKRVKNMTCKTTFTEWMKLLSHAEFVLGNDSGYIHLSYFLGSQAFAIAGYWAYGRFLPYEKNDVKDIVPICICAPEPSCALCEFDGNEKTDECEASIKTRGRCKCIEDVCAKDVIATIDAWLIQKGLKYAN